MSYTVSPHDPTWDVPPDQPSSHSLRLLAVIAGAVLFVLGIVIGGLMGRSEAPRELNNSSSEIVSLRAEINLLTREVAQAKANSLDLEKRLLNQQVLMTQPQTPAKENSDREVFLGQAIEVVNSKREVCLQELEQFQRRSTGVPTSQVIRFAETLFETQIQILNSLASGETPPSTLLDLQRSFAMDLDSISAQDVRSNVAVTTKTAASHASLNSTRQSRSSVNQRASVPTLAEPTLAEPTLAEPTLADESHRKGMFFTAPQRRRQGVTFFTPRPPSRVASRPKSGMTFTDTSEAEAGPIFR